MLYEPVIGLEVHAQLLTKAKMFCSCRADYSGAMPNTLVCPVCLGMPGTLPVINEQAVAFAVMTALALNCRRPASLPASRTSTPTCRRTTRSPSTISRSRATAG